MIFINKYAGCCVNNTLYSKNISELECIASVE